MLKQSIQTNSIIYGAARFIQEQQEAERRGDGYQAKGALLVGYDILRAIGLPSNGLEMLFGGLAEVLDPPQAFPDQDPLKCQLCEEAAFHLVKTSGGNILTVCDQCSTGLMVHGAEVLL